MVANMVSDIEVDMVADMEVDKVADMMADMEMKMVADKEVHKMMNDQGRQGHRWGGELKVRADCAGIGAK